MTCICLEGILKERNGHTATCNRENRKAEERAKRVKIVQREIKKISPKMAKALKEYEAKRKKFLSEHPKCAVYPDQKATTVHHMKGRSSIDLLLDEYFWLACSVEGHRKIELNPEWAKQNGFSVNRLTTRSD